MEPSRSARINIKMAFFNPYKDEYKFYNEEKKKIMKTAFMVFYLDELRDELKKIVVKMCRCCNQDIGGKAPPIYYPHTCSTFNTLQQAYKEFGPWAMSSISQNNKIRWRICQKWWNFIFDLPMCSSIKEKDAINFSREAENDFFHTLQYGWEEEFKNVIERFYWDDPNSNNIDDMLKELSKW